MKVMCIWTKDQEKNIIKIARSKSELKNAKVSGRKPDKIITRSSELDKMKPSLLKAYVSYDGTIVMDGKVVYDKRIKVV